MKRQVLVYYANETSLDLRRLRRIEERIEQLRRTSDKPAIAAADRIFTDIDLFPRTTYQQIVELQRVAREHGKQAGLAGAVVFDNETSRCGWFEIQEAGGYESRKEAFRDVTACHRLLEDSPLSGPSALSAALGAVAALYSPRDHDFVLITRSHGSDVLAMTLGLFEATLDRVVAAKAELKRSLGLLIEPDSREATDLGPNYLGIYNLGNGSGLGEEAGLGEYDLGEGGLGDNGQSVLGGKGLILGTPALAEEGVGITKQAYLDILEAAGNSLLMEFSLVFMDSCGSNIPRELAREVPPNVRKLFGSTKAGLRYEAPDYFKLGRDIGVQDGIVAAMERLLEQTQNVTRFVLEQEGKRLSTI